MKTTRFYVHNKQGLKTVIPNQHGEIVFNNSTYKLDIWLANYLRKHLQMPVNAVYSKIPFGEHNPFSYQTGRDGEPPYMTSTCGECLVFFNNGRIAKLDSSEYFTIQPYSVSKKVEPQYTPDSVFDLINSRTGIRGHGVLDKHKALDFALTYKYIYVISNLNANRLVNKQLSRFCALSDSPLNVGTKFPPGLVCQIKLFAQANGIQEDQASVKRALQETIDFHMDCDSFTMFSSNRFLIEHLNTLGKS